MLLYDAVSSKLCQSVACEPWTTFLNHWHSSREIYYSTPFRTNELHAHKKRHPEKTMHHICFPPPNFWKLSYAAPTFNSLVVSTAAGYRLDDNAIGIRVRVGSRIISSPRHPYRLWGLSHQWVPGILSPGVKQQGHEADHSPLASAEVKKTWVCKSTPPYAFMVGWLVYSCCSHLEHRTSMKRFFSLQFINLRHSVRLLGRVINPSQDRYLTQTQAVL
jgi:hypothetical protein